MWNYRVVKTAHSDIDCFGVHEVYYNEAGEIFAYTERAIEPYGESLEELRLSMGLIALALQHPVLDAALIPEAEMPLDLPEALDALTATARQSRQEPE